MCAHKKNRQHPFEMNLLKAIPKPSCSTSLHLSGVNVGTTESACVASNTDKYTINSKDNIFRLRIKRKGTNRQTFK